MRKKVARFAAVFIPAYVLTRILWAIFSFGGFRLSEPRFVDLVLDLTFWSAAWTVSVIVFVTVRDAFEKKNVQELESE